MTQNRLLFTARPLLWALALAAPLSACDALLGKEVARLPVNAVSTAGHEVEKEASLPLKKDDEIALWSEMDVAYEGEAPMRFQVRVTKNGVPVNQLEFDPTAKNVTVGEVKTDLNGRVDWRFSGKNAEFKVPETGTYTFTARLVAAANPSLKIAKAEVVLKK